MVSADSAEKWCYRMDPCVIARLTSNALGFCLPDHCGRDDDDDEEAWLKRFRALKVFGNRRWEPNPFDLYIMG